MRLLFRGVYKYNQVKIGRPVEIREYYNSEENMQRVCEEQELNSVAELEYRPDPEEILDKIKREANLIIEQTRLEFEKLIRESEQDALNKSRVIFENARNEGYRQGAEKAAKDFEQKLKEADELIKQAKIEHDGILARMESEIIDLALEIARSVIGREMQEHKEYIVDVFKQALQKCCNREKVTLKASRWDFELLSQSRDEILAATEGLQNIEIVEDPSLSAGDCIIETSFGAVNAGVNKKLKKIEDEFSKLCVNFQQMKMQV